MQNYYANVPQLASFRYQVQNALIFPTI
jgi:hypothetical protein